MSHVGFYSTIRSFPFGAPDEIWVRTAHRLLQGGHRVSIAVSQLLLSHPRVRALINCGAKLYLLPRLLWGGKIQTLKKYILGLRDGSYRTISALMKSKLDLLFVSQGGFTDFLLEQELRDAIAKFRVPYILICHSNIQHIIMKNSDRELVRAFISGARKLLVNSYYILELGERQFVTRFTNAAVFQNPANVPSNIPVPLPDLGVPCFAVVSRLDAYIKGLDLLIEALVRSPGLKELWHLNIYGDGPDRSYLNELVVSRGLKDHVTFHGYVEDKEIIWKNNHMLLLPSRHEGFGVAMLEALLCGRPVLRTYGGGVTEWMRDGVNGFVCPAADVGLLADTLSRAWQYRYHWHEMGRAATCLAQQAYDPHPENKIIQLADL